MTAARTALRDTGRVLLTPAERDRLLLYTAAELARSRRARGLRLNVPETIAVVADTVCETARDGARHADALAAGLAALGPDDVLPGVAAVVTEVKVEAVFEDGTRLVVVPHPVGLPPPPLPAARTGDHARHDHRSPDVVEVTVVNTAAVPISVSSHFHFFEANPRLRFDRGAAYGRHLAAAAGSTVRFDPGEEVTAGLVPIAGERVVIGFSGLVDGPLDAPGAREAALRRARECGFLGAGQAEPLP
jgi:urease subunit gamma/beta